MTSHPLLDMLDEFAQEVQGKLAKAENEELRCAPNRMPRGFASTRARASCYREFAKMLHTIRAQVEDMIKEKQLCWLGEKHGGWGYIVPDPEEEAP